MERLLRKIAWSYSKKSRIDFEELLAEANLAYLEALRTYDESKGKVTTHVWTSVTGKLKTYIRDEVQHTCMPIDEIEKEYYSAPYFEKIGKDAQEIAELVLSNPDYIYMDQFDAQVKIGQDLLQKGWNWTKICRSFKELTFIFA